LLLVGLLVVSACASPPAAPPSHTIRGVLVDVESRGLQQLDRFSIRTDSGEELTFTPAPNFNQGELHAMTPGHMRQHMALADPVTVTYRDDGGHLVALSATD
jgi:hypothetical protein